MLRSLYSAVSGIDVNQKSMDVIGNNIANVNTTGFKMGRAVFQDLMSQTLVGGKTPTDSRGGINPRQVGNGAYLASVDNIFEPGVIKATQRTNDLAIEGNGMFIVRGEGNNEQYYTRAGDFNFDRSQTLTTPSGYKVQGWMADPDTGEMLTSKGVGDIVLGTEYLVMKPRASSQVNISGSLDTNAKATILKYTQFLTEAAAKQSLASVMGAGGNPLNLTDGEEIEIKAHATTRTPVANLVSGTGNPFPFTDGSGVTFTINNVSHTIHYNASGGGTKGDGNFNTVEEFIEEVNNIFIDAGVSAAMTLNDGQFKVTANVTDGSSFVINSITAPGGMQEVLAGLATTYSGNTYADSKEVFFKKSVKVGEDFDSLEALGAQITTALNGNVVSGGFNVEFLNNNFGLKDGESISFDNITIGGAAIGAVGPFVYSETPNPTAANSFHTVQELAKLITDGVNNSATAMATVPPTRISYSLLGNKITLSHIAGSEVLMNESTLHAAPGGAEPNPYLKSIFDNSLNGYDAAGTHTPKPLNSAQNALYISEIAGKGRLAYSYSGTSTAMKVDLANNLMSMTNGETITFNVGGVNHTITYQNPPTAGVVSEFNDTTTLAAALADATGLTVAFNAATGQLELTNGTGAPIAITSVTTTSTLPYLKNMLAGVLANTSIADGETKAMNGSLPEVAAITGISIDTVKNNSGGFKENMVLSDSLSLNKAVTSNRFLTVADENSNILDLFNPSGESFNFVENESTLNFNASVGGEKIPNNNFFNIQVSSTVKDLMEAMENYLGLGRDHNTLQNVVMKDGVIEVTGEKGKGNAIDFFEVMSPSSKHTVFNNAMKGATAQTASGGNYPTAIEIFDEQGNKHAVNFTFTIWNEERNEWRLVLEPDDPTNTIAINGATSNELILRFNSDGTLSHMYDRFPDPSKIIANPTLRFSAANGTNTIDNIALNLGSAGSTDGLTIASGGGGFRQNSTDGYAIGELKEKMFNTAGELVGSYSNGEVRTLAQVGLALFTNYQGLLKVGDTMFQETGNSGRATIGQPETGGRGDIAASSLENSNVDLSQELVSMITTQRGFQANSKVVSTSDEMIQELLNMKR